MISTWDSHICTFTQTTVYIYIHICTVIQSYTCLPHPPTHTYMHAHTHTHQVKEVYVKENDSIGEDEVILEFYPEEQD